jgi:hypothetical protein
MNPILRKALATGVLGGAQFQFKFKVSVSAGNTISPKFTFAAGAPAAKLDWGDGTAQDTLTSNVAKSHTFASTGVYIVTLVMPNCFNWITQIDVNTCKISDTNFLSQVIRLHRLTSLIGYTNGVMGSLSLAQLPAGMTQFNLVSTTSTITGTLAQLPAGMISLDLGDTTSTITGTLAQLPAGMTNLSLWSTTSTITGAINTMPSGMIYLVLLSTTSTITGGATQMVAKGLQTVTIQNISLSQSNVDDVLSRLATDVAVMTYHYPSINLGPNDATPSAAGLVNKGILTTAGWTVTTTP